MKNLNKVFGGLLLALGLLALASPAQAVWYGGSPKEVFVSSYTTGAILVTPVVSSNAVAGAQYMSGVVYQVVLSSGAASEYELLVDTTNCVGVTATLAVGNLPAQGYQMIGPRLLYGSTTANTTITFDPPIRFDQGLCIIDSAVTGQASITYELGRGVSGK